MMKVILFLLVVQLTVAPKALAQTTYSIIYSHPERRAPMSLMGNEVVLPGMETRFVFNDSFTFTYSYMKGEDPVKKSKKDYGEKLIPHGQYFNKITGIPYSSGHSSPKILKFLSIPVIVKRTWSNANTKKIILGYLCNSVFTVNMNNDSLLIYYTTEIPEDGSLYPHLYNGIAGVIMEVYDQSCKCHYVATQITESEKRIKFPADVPVVSKEEVKERVKNARKRSRGPGIFVF